MKEDNRKKIPLPPEVYDQFIALKSDDETTTDLVKRCIEILSPQDLELTNEHTIATTIEAGDYDYMRFVLGIELPRPLDPRYDDGFITMLVDLRALFPYTGENVSHIRPERDICGLKRRDGQTVEDASREFFAAQTTEE